MYAFTYLATALLLALPGSNAVGIVLDSKLSAKMGTAFRNDPGWQKSVIQGTPQPAVSFENGPRDFSIKSAKQVVHVGISCAV